MPNEWGSIIPSVADGTRPASSFGTVVTPGFNAYGSYASLIAGAAVTHDVHEIWINFNANVVVGSARDSLATIGVDPAGGSSFTPLIEHLSCACAAGFHGSGAVGGGIWYRFPVFIKAGSSIGCAASVNNATVGTLSAHVVLFGAPSRPDAIWAGSFVQTFGADPAASSGSVAIVAGGASEGAWVEIGTLDKPIRFIDFGLGVNASVMQSASMVVDLALGDATNKKIIIPGALVFTTTNEVLARDAAGRYCSGAPGDKIYGRAQAGGSGNTGVSILAYGVG